MYKELLLNQPILSANVNRLVSEMSTGVLTSSQFHNKKAYAKRSGDLLSVLELVIAWEIYKGGYYA